VICDQQREPKYEDMKITRSESYFVNSIGAHSTINHCPAHPFIIPSFLSSLCTWTSPSRDYSIPRFRFSQCSQSYILRRRHGECFTATGSSSLPCYVDTTSLPPSSPQPSPCRRAHSPYPEQLVDMPRFTLGEDMPLVLRAPPPLVPLLHLGLVYLDLEQEV
jgi:hypothetical protein